MNSLKGEKGPVGAVYRVMLCMYCNPSVFRCRSLCGDEGKKSEEAENNNVGEGVAGAVYLLAL